MKTLFHGTTLENWLKIKEEGFAPEQQTWNVPCFNETYFYDMDKTSYPEDEDYSKEECIRQAFDNAQISASVQNFMGNTLVVLELEVDEELVEDDQSCENMDNVASVVNNDDLDLSMIKKVHTCENGYLPSFRLLYVVHLIQNNDYFVTNTFNNIEIEMAEQLNVPFVDEMHNFEYETENVYFDILEAV